MSPRPDVKQLVADYRKLRGLRAVAAAQGMSPSSVLRRLRAELGKEAYADLVAEVRRSRRSVVVREDKLTLDRAAFKNDLRGHGSIRAACAFRGVSRSDYDRALRRAGLVGSLRAKVVKEVARENTIEEYLELCRATGHPLTSADLRRRGEHRLYAAVTRHFCSHESFRNIAFRTADRSPDENPDARRPDPSGPKG